MTDTFKTESRRALSEGDRYLALLAIVLLGYALMGKGFAYLGFPPLYVGEIAFLTRNRRLSQDRRIGRLACDAAEPHACRADGLGPGANASVRGVYGFDSLRDSTIVMYGGFAFIVIGLLLEDARRIDTVLRYYNILLASFPAIFVGFCLTRYWVEYIPRLYGPVPIVDITTSAVGTHLAGTMVFVLIGYRKVSVVWVSRLVRHAGSWSPRPIAARRLPSSCPVMFAMLVLGRLRLLVTTVLAAVSIFAVLLTVEGSFTQHDEYNDPKQLTERPVSAHQILENAKSIVGQSGQQN